MHSAKWVALESVLEEEWSLQSQKEYARWRNVRRKEQRKRQNTLLKALDEVIALAPVVLHIGLFAQRTARR